MSPLATLFRVSLIASLWLTVAGAHAQRNAYWIEGKVTFKNGHTQYCVLNYDATVSEGLLQVKEDRQLLTYSVREVESFSFFDDYAGQWRRFYSVPLYLTSGRVTRNFFMELVYHGPRWSILRKKERWVGSYTYQVLLPESYVIQRPEKKIKYARYYEVSYLLNMETGEIEELTEDALRTAVSDRQPAMRAYIKAHRLRFHTMDDFVEVLDYYHRLPQSADGPSGITVSPTE